MTISFKEMICLNVSKSAVYKALFFVSLFVIPVVIFVKNTMMVKVPNGYEQQEGPAFKANINPDFWSDFWATFVNGFALSSSKWSLFSGYSDMNIFHPTAFLWQSVFCLPAMLVIAYFLLKWMKLHGKQVGKARIYKLLVIFGAYLLSIPATAFIIALFVMVGMNLFL